MKALKDCEWEVRPQIMYGVNGGRWFYLAFTSGAGITELEMDGLCRDERTAKRRWAKFAKLNGIKKWRFVEVKND